MYKHLLSTSIFLLGFLSGLFAQEIRPSGSFQQDSLYLGQPVQYSLSVSYPEHFMVVMPDSSFNFAPFELLSYDYFPTQTEDGISTDSVVYTLATYTLGSPKHLRLPAYIVRESDSLTLFTAADSLALKEVINTATVDSLQFESNAAWAPVRKQLNYPLIILLLFAIVVVALIALAVFGNSLKQKWRLYQLKKKHKRYRQAYETALQQYKPGDSPEPLLARWKQYMESLENRPYTKLSAREIIALSQENERLIPALRKIERELYGYSGTDGLQESLQTLLEEAEMHYQTLKEEIQHAN